MNSEFKMTLPVNPYSNPRDEIQNFVPLSRGELPDSYISYYSEGFDRPFISFSGEFFKDIPNDYRCLVKEILRLSLSCDMKKEANVKKLLEKLSNFLNEKSNLSFTEGHAKHLEKKFWKFFDKLERTPVFHNPRGHMGEVSQILDVYYVPPGNKTELLMFVIRFGDMVEVVPMSFEKIEGIFELKI